jgi:hypothetical protein
MSARELINELNKQFTLQIALYQEMRLLAHSQSELCAKADFPGEQSLAELNRLLSGRRQHIDRIGNYQKKAVALKSQLQQDLGADKIDGDYPVGPLPLP